MKTIIATGSVGLALCWATYLYGGAAGDIAAERVRYGLFKDPLVFTAPAPAVDKEELSALEAVAQNERSPRTQAAFFEQFIIDHPGSGWAPSLRFQLGEYYRDHSRYGRALEHWEVAWGHLAAQPAAPEVRLACAQVLASLARLHLGLGNRPRAGELLQASAYLEPPEHKLVLELAALREIYGRAASDPESASTCGRAALAEVLKAVRPGDQAVLSHALQVRAARDGVSLLELGRAAAAGGLSASIVRVAGRFPVPSVIHFRSGHFAAVTEQDGKRYKLIDSVFGEPRWVLGADLIEDTSGAALLVGSNPPEGWTLLPDAEAASLVGKGYPNTISDPEDWWTGAAATYGSPSWDVSQPFTTLWIEVVGSSYGLADGAQQRMRMLYSQRNGWMTHWSGHIYYLSEYDEEFRVYNHTPLSTVLPKGGVHFYSHDGIPRETFGLGVLQQNSSQSYDYANWKIDYPDGKRMDFSYQVYYALGYRRAYVRSTLDSNSRATGVFSETANGLARVVEIRDYELRSTRLYYSSTNSGLPSQIVNPYNLTNNFAYDASNRPVTNWFTTNLHVAFTYDQAGVITNLATVYGATAFRYTSDTNSGNVVARSLAVTLPTGARHLYMYRDQSTKLNPSSNEDLLPFSYPTNQVPSSAPFTNTFDNTWMDARNSFHWGPIAYEKLSSQFRASGNFNDLTVADYRLATLAHWLRKPPAQLSQVVSMIREPSPDGVTEGSKRWFDYWGKTSVVETNQGQTITNWYTTGTNTLPRVVGQVLPDANSYFIYSEYNSALQPTTVVSTFGNPGTIQIRTNRFSYDFNNLLRYEYGPDGALVRSNTYNANRQLLTSANQLGETTIYTYSGAAPYLLTSIKLPNGLLTTNFYYVSGQTNFLDRSETPALGITNSYTYTNGLAFTLKNERGLFVTNHYDHLRRLIATTSSAGTNRVSYTNLLVAHTVNALNYTNFFGYDQYGRKQWESDPLGRTNRFDYCPCGSLSGVSDPLGQWTSFYYDHAGKLLSAVYPDSYWVSNRYDVLGRLLVASDSAGRATTNYYNQQGLVYSASNTLGRLFLRLFDVYDRPTNIVDISGLSTTQQYDPLGRLLRSTYCDGSWEALGYASNVSGPVTFTNRLGNRTLFGYDLAGRKTRETNALQRVIEWQYGVSGELLSLKDEKANMRQWGYDILGRMTFKTNAVSARVLALSYDALGRITNRWTPAKGSVGYAYDPVGNLTNIDYPTLTDVRMQYDPLNRLTNMVDAVGTTRLGFTPTATASWEHGPWEDDTIAYTNSQRQLSTAGLQGAWASTWGQAYGYDQALRLTNITSAAGAFGYSFDPAKPANLNRLSYPSGAYLEHGYDHLQRLTNLVFRAPGGTMVDSRGCTFNIADQPTRQTRKDGSYVDYLYDKLGQLCNATGRESGGALRAHEQFGYGYDDAGNLAARTNNAFVQSFTVNNRDELDTITRSGTFTVAGGTAASTTNVTVNSLASALYADASYASQGHTLQNGSNTFTVVALAPGAAVTNTAQVFLPATVSHTYDADGNLTSDGQRGFVYDDDDRLIQITLTNQWRSQFVHDGQGRRRIRREYTYDSGSSNYLLVKEVRYVYSGLLVIQERDANNVPEVSYARGVDLSGSHAGAGGIGGLLARIDHATSDTLLMSAFYFADFNGNVVSLVATNSQRSASYLYDPYGNPIASWGPLAESNTYRYSSKELHSRSGMIFFGARYYSPALQRWINQDPILELGGVNLHTYVANSPGMLTDPFGMDTYIKTESIGGAPGQMAPSTIIGTDSVDWFGNWDRMKAAQAVGGNTQGSAGGARANWKQPSRTGGSEWQGIGDDPTKLYRALSDHLRPLAPGQGVLERGVSFYSTMIIPGEFIAPVTAPIVKPISSLLLKFISKPLASVTAKSGVWEWEATVRGTAIENRLAATEYRGWFRVGQLDDGTFPLIDFQQGNNLVSLKTVDTTGSTWLGRMQAHIQDLGSRGATVNGNPANMILDIRVQPGGAGAAQQLIGYGQARGVTVIVKELP